MPKFLRGGMSEQDVQAVVDRAVSAAKAEASVTAALTATVTAHMATCATDKAEAKAEQLRLHNENKDRFKEIETQVRALQKWIWVATGVMAVVSLIGKEIAARILGG